MGGGWGVPHGNANHGKERALYHSESDEKEVRETVETDVEGAAGAV